MSRKSRKHGSLYERTISFACLQNDDLPDDMKPDVEFNCEEEVELPKKSVNKKPHKTKSRGKPVRKHNKSKATDEGINDDCPNQKVYTVKDSSSEVELPKNSNTKEKKEKVGKMCQICGQIFKSLQAHLYVHDIYPKFECNVRVVICRRNF